MLTTIQVHSFCPDVVVVQKSVARLAQELLRETGTTLISSLKERGGGRIARSTQGELGGRVENQLREPRLGRCGQFRAETHKLVGCSLRHPSRLGSWKMYILSIGRRRP